LIKRPRIKLAAISFGGSQEDGLRPGTEPKPLVVGAALAIELAQKENAVLSHRITNLRDRWLQELLTIDKVVVNGSLDHRLPNNVNISIPGFDSEFAVIVLDKFGVAASTKSACAGAGSGRSHVVFSMTKDAERASSTIRFSLSPTTTLSELRKVTKILRQHLEKMSTPASFDHK
jgi:cysteine desulfurase